ncbi:IS4 family transposase [Desulfobacter hydrogenophilus]|uniref:IS4 family transposase n=4 Tax=Desulfobacter hydrogenophilus TaxID=2291 RepID=A0ABX5RE71_9BACT|nr:transposase [Desulfobacter hydrogenophilus]QBH12430.1 IS4 family transposase [Desulfobacter hydrogenophilus]QBH12604.1 IS4 family transposase [Desulfobacter hydrogenophilus]QBH12865.1 IS4 family transposase [Desulfobacter hydrogenophilus]QBH13043.1 IS4 family transposase [Desulfobacter hydrogenophilus]QBH13248.1 IS4 family transposase [Desulfobacter hydrogenophilus]
MNTTLTNVENQMTNSEQIGVLNDYFTKFKIGKLLNQSGIVKTKGASPLAIFTALFNLAFHNKNLYQGIVKNKKVDVDKDAAYNFLNSPTYNWRRFTLQLCRRIYFIIRKLLDDSSEEVLIFDDSTYSRNRSKKVELLSRVFDHTDMKYIKGFRMLTLGWSDGNSFLGLDFALLSSVDKKNRYNEINPDIDKRTCGYHRRQEAVTKTTAHLVPMVKRALDMGVRAKYILMDSWFSMPSAIANLREYIHVICMLKDHPKWLYEYQGKKLRLSELYGKLKKKRGRAKVKAQAIVTLSNGKQAKIIFVPCDKKRGWLALLSTDLALPNEEIIRLYGKRWDIEVFFKMCKQHLKLVKEIQIRNYDGLVGHTSLVIARYNILSLYQRQCMDQRSFGELFRACNDEMTNLSFMVSLERIMRLALVNIRQLFNFTERMVQVMLDQVMGQALKYFGFSSRPEELLGV